MGETSGPSSSRIPIEEGTVELPPQKQASAWNAPMHARPPEPAETVADPLADTLRDEPIPTSAGHTRAALKGIAIGLVVAMLIFVILRSL